jgi:cell wall-associated NlpC family hydrolase
LRGVDRRRLQRLFQVARSVRLRARHSTAQPDRARRARTPFTKETYRSKAARCSSPPAALGTGREAKRSAGARARARRVAHQLEDAEEHVVVEAADQVGVVTGCGWG